MCAFIGDAICANDDEPLTMGEQHMAGVITAKPYDDQVSEFDEQLEAMVRKLIDCVAERRKLLNITPIRERKVINIMSELRS